MLVPKKSLPPRLYKYQPFNAQTLTNLKRGWIWFSAPINVNDPYDCGAWFVEDTVSESDFQRLLAYARKRDPALAARLTADQLRESFVNSVRKVYEERRTVQRGTIQRVVRRLGDTGRQNLQW